MFKVSIEFSQHEGGTKYYQVITIIGSPATPPRRGVCVTHWGSMSPGAALFPKYHGQRKIEFCERSVDTATRQAIKRKVTRGYSIWSNRADDTYANESELRAALNELFSMKDAQQIMAFLDRKEWHADSDEFVVPENEPDPKVEPEPEPVRGGEWGTW